MTTTRDRDDRDSTDSAPVYRRPILVIQHDTDAPPALLAEVASDLRIALVVRVLEKGAEVPEDIDDVAGVVLLGGAMGVADAPFHPHLYEEMQLVQRAAEADRPVLGICLGGQLAARALGGSVRKLPQGPEIGWTFVRATEQAPRDQVASVVGEGAPLFQWHFDEFDLPPGALPLLWSERCLQGFRYGSVWGLQAHPEVDAATISTWCEDPDGIATLRDAKLMQEDLLEGSREKSAFGKRLLEAWCRMVVATEPVQALESVHGAIRSSGRSPTRTS